MAADHRSAEERARALFRWECRPTYGRPPSMDDVQKVIEEHAAQEVRRALERWVPQHDPTCLWPARPCSCGLIEALTTGIVPP